MKVIAIYKAFPIEKIRISHFRDLRQDTGYILQLLLLEPLMMMKS